MSYSFSLSLWYVLDNNVSRDRLSHVRLVGNLVGFRSLDTFDWNDNILWGRSVTVDARPGIPTINYHKLMHSNVENNLMKHVQNFIPFLQNMIDLCINNKFGDATISLLMCLDDHIKNNEKIIKK